MCGKTQTGYTDDAHSGVKGTMKLSKRQKSRLHACITNVIADLRSSLLQEPRRPAANYIDFKIAQTVRPLTNKVIEALEGGGNAV